MKALSLQQPYANLMRDGEKTIETRVWAPKEYRGDVLICSSRVGAEPGRALCIVEFYDWRMMTDADEVAACVERYPRARSWLTRNLRVLAEPFPVKGSLGLFEIEVDDSMLRTVPA